MHFYCDILLFLFLGETVNFNVSVRLVENFPLDLYYLMDLSFSMRDDLKNMKLLGRQLGQSICLLKNCCHHFVFFVLFVCGFVACFFVLVFCFVTLQFHLLSASALRQRTSNVRLGFGTFVDKAVDPYADMAQ